MITYFPDLYKDELIYSTLARFYYGAGYLARAYALEEIYAYRQVRPDPYFINKLHPEIINRITREMPLAELIEKHTMYPYYARFMEKTRRQKAFQALIEQNGNYNNLLVMPHKKEGQERYLMYCPLCAKEDRERYGETYWHRNHQLTGVDVCTIHSCFLEESSVIVDGRASPTLVAAEWEVPMEQDVVHCDNVKEISLAEYIIRVFQAPLDLDCDVPIGRFLHSKLGGTRYLSKTGIFRKLTEFYEDFLLFYEEISKEKIELFNIQKIFNGYRHNFSEVCELAYFMNIRPSELADMRIPDDQSKMDALYKRLSDSLKIDVKVVKTVGEAVLKEYKKEPKAYHKSGPKVKAWDRLDAEYLPKVKEVIEELYGGEGRRPHKITKSLVKRTLGLADKQLDSLPLCLAEIRKFEETQEQYWAREVVWAAQKILKEGQVLSWKKVRTLTNMRRTYFLSCLPHINEFADKEMSERIKAL